MDDVRLEVSSTTRCHPKDPHTYRNTSVEFRRGQLLSSQYAGVVSGLFAARPSAGASQWALSVYAPAENFWRGSNPCPPRGNGVLTAVLSLQAAGGPAWRSKPPKTQGHAPSHRQARSRLPIAAGPLLVGT
jgi:hypothetical protein